MKVIKTAYTALVLIVFFALIAMVVVYAKADLNDLENTIRAIADNTAKESTEDKPEETQNNQTLLSVSSSSLTYTKPYMVTGTDDLLSYNDNTNIRQSPNLGQQSDSDLLELIDEKLLVKTENVDYENVIELSYETIYSLMYDENMSIWQIAAKNDKINLLENVYCGYYSEMIIQMVNDEAITKDIADELLEHVIYQLNDRNCLTPEEMLEYVNSISGDE